MHNIKTKLATLATLVVALTLGLAIVACGGDDDGGNGVVDDDHENGGELQEIAVVATDSFAYEPRDLTVHVGQPVRITLENEGALVHDLLIEGMPADDVHAEGAEHGDDEADGHDDADLHVAVSGGETGTLEFTPTEAGEFVFYCTVEGHRDAGMEGTITVES